MVRYFGDDPDPFVHQGVGRPAAVSDTGGILLPDQYVEKALCNRDTSSISRRALVVADKITFPEVSVMNCDCQIFLTELQWRDDHLMFVISAE
jgi:hypothetical protein